MFGLNRKLSENLALPILISFAFAGLLGVGMGMEMTDNQMSSCPFMANQAVMCQMSVTEHITRWQQALLGIPTKANLLALIVVLLVMVAVSSAKPFAARLFAYQKSCFVKNLDPPLIAFSDGILNPKIYEPARI